MTEGTGEILCEPYVSHLGTERIKKYITKQCITLETEYNHAANII